MRQQTAVGIYFSLTVLNNFQLQMLKYPESMENRTDDIIHPAYAALRAFCNSQHLRHVCGAALPVLTGCIQFTSAYKTFYRESYRDRFIRWGHT